MLQSHPSVSPFLRQLRRRSPLHLSFHSTRSRLCSTNLPTMNSKLEDPPAESCLLAIIGKSAADKDLGKSLKLNHAGADVPLIISTEESSSILEKFAVKRYMEALSTTRFGRVLLFSPSLPSTQDVVSQNFAELPVGAVCVAEIQSSGRGRTKNIWDSPPGCLMFSFTLEMEDGRVLPLLQYVVSLAITEAITNSCKSNGLPPLDIKIKWPNDLYLNGLKIGGVLCTSTYKSKKFNVSAGVGLNLDNEKPTTSLNSALRGLMPVSREKFLEREEVLASFFNNFENLFEKFLKEGFKVMEELYYKRWLHSGQRVEIEEEQGKIGVTIEGLSKSGYLLAVDDEGNLFELHPDGNSLDFFKGLVRRKLP